MQFTDYDRLKWESMVYVIDRCSWDAFGYALNKSKLTDDRQETKELIERLARELFDEELIFGTYTSYSEAYNRKFREYTPVSREQWERELDTLWIQPEFPAGESDTLEQLWIFPTLLGQIAYLSQPAEAFFDKDGFPSVEALQETLAQWSTDWSPS